MSVPQLLTDPEKVRIRHHLGYLNVQEASTFVLGVPASVETQFIIEGAMNRVLVSALPLVRELIAKCDATEGQYFEDQENLAVNKVGSIELREDEGEALMGKGGRYDYWVNALANALGVVPNPFDKRPGRGGGGGVNIPVRG